MPRPPSIPLAPGALPVLGHAVPLLRDALAFTSSLPALGRWRGSVWAPSRS